MKRRTRLILTVTAIVVLGAGLVVTLALRQASNGRAAFKPTKKAEVKQLPEKVSVYCSRAGTAVYCQDIIAASTKKYVLPHEVALADSLQPSRNEARFLAITPANPIHSRPKQNAYVTDAAFKVVREIPAYVMGDGAGLTWAANDQYLLFTRPAGGRNDVYSYEIANNAVHKITKQPVAAEKPSVSADGKTIYMSATESKKGDAVIAIDARSGEPRELNTSELNGLVKQVITATYSSATDRFYITGLDMQDKPLTLAARLDGDVLRSIGQLQGGAAYTVQSLAQGGLMALRQLPGKNDFGIINAAGQFNISKVRPTGHAPFGLSGFPILSGSQSTVPEVGDFLYSYDVKPPTRVSGYLQSLINGSCAAKTYNQVSLLAADGEGQAAASITNCQTGVRLQHYYKYQDGAYADVLQTDLLPDCEVVHSLKLSRVVVPECSEEGHTDSVNQSGHNEEGHNTPPPLLPVEGDPRQASSNGLSGQAEDDEPADPR